MSKSPAHEEDVKTRKRFANVEPYTVEGVARRKLRRLRALSRAQRCEGKQFPIESTGHLFRPAMHSTQADLAMLYSGPGNQKVAKNILKLGSPSTTSETGHVSLKKLDIEGLRPSAAFEDMLFVVMS